MKGHVPRWMPGLALAGALALGTMGSALAAPIAGFGVNTSQTTGEVTPHLKKVCITQTSCWFWGLHCKTTTICTTDGGGTIPV